MSQINTLKLFVNERLAAAAEEIFGMMEKTFIEHHVEISRLSKELDYQRRILDIALKPQLKLHRTDHQHKSSVYSPVKEISPKQQHGELKLCFSSVKEEPETPQVKEEREEVLISPGEPNQGLEVDTQEFILSQTSVRSEDQSPTRTQEKSEELPGTPTNQTKTELACKLDSIELLQSKTHTAPYTCKICEKAFQYKGNLVRHVQLHANDAKCICGVCGESFLQSSELKSHIQFHKTVQYRLDGKPQCCKVCGRGFNKRACLNVHMRSHMGGKSFSCHVCGKGFGSRGNLTEHIRTHTGGKMYNCNDCNKRFTKCTHRVKLYCCHMCGKEVYTSEDLKKHMVIHIGEKPYSCQVCGKGVSSSTNLDKHMKIHIRK
ncbi:zinc finger protein 501-like isoform X1 [Hypomesus transpacificus]|uniref:zinc finger protein 501-like isoform X1 n=2 Tax=Hypomesus transpacificus TaxID=137520 RepID=UPI001F071FB5|nr:zinc finger protein 501-like isoform X1 [Hypomesus transpacificus]